MFETEAPERGGEQAENQGHCEGDYQEIETDFSSKSLRRHGDDECNGDHLGENSAQPTGIDLNRVTPRLESLPDELLDI